MLDHLTYFSKSFFFFFFFIFPQTPALPNVTFLHSHLDTAPAFCPAPSTAGLIATANSLRSLLSRVFYDDEIGYVKCPSCFPKLHAFTNFLINLQNIQSVMSS